MKRRPRGCRAWARRRAGALGWSCFGASDHGPLRSPADRAGSWPARTCPMWGHDLRGSRQSGCLKPQTADPRPRRARPAAAGRRALCWCGLRCGALGVRPGPAGTPHARPGRAGAPARRRRALEEVKEVSTGGGFYDLRPMPNTASMPVSRPPSDPAVLALSWFPITTSTTYAPTAIAIRSTTTHQGTGGPEEGVRRVAGEPDDGVEGMYGPPGPAVQRCTRPLGQHHPPGSHK